MGDIGLVSRLMPQSLWAEAYRSARTNLEFLRRGQSHQVILVASPCPGDGKSTTASNLALSLAQAGRKVLLVDADLRRPRQDRIHNASMDRGLVHVLQGVQTLEQVVQKTPDDNLDLITVGPIVSNPAELLTSPRLGEFLEDVRRSYHSVILDSSPLLAVTDASIIGGAVDGIVLVVLAPSVRRHEAARALEVLRVLGTPVIGTVINGIERGRGGKGYGYGGQAYGYGYGYGYGYASGRSGINGSMQTSEEAPVSARAEFTSNGSPDSPPLEG
jgi:capsular exopolysaccharide synthesis family protein